MPKFQGCAIFRTRVIKRVSLKIIVFSMETPCCSPSEELQHGGRKPAETFGVYFGSLKTFILSVTLENIRIGTSLNILVTQNSKTKGESIFSCTQHVTVFYPKIMPMSRIVKKNVCFKTKRSTELKTGQQIYV